MKNRMIAILVLVGLLVSPLVALAGDSTGDSGKTPMSLEKSSIESDEQGIELDTTFVLTFSKNIVNMSVSENNLTMFKLEDSEGNDIDIDVIFADDQVNKEARNDAVIDPAASLEEDTDYILTVNKGLTSKSGVSLANDLTIQFSTKKAGLGASRLLGIAFIAIGAAMWGYSTWKKRR